MAICSRCGEDNPARARFCLGCGASLAAGGGGREVRKTVTVVFSDLVGSTPLGEKLDPESLREVITRYYDRAAEVLTRHGGTVAKFIGDAVMAVYGIPRLHETPDLQGAYPRLSEEQVEILATAGDRRPTRPGEVLYREGQEDYDFFVVLAGTVAVVEEDGGAERVVSVHGPGRFLGELSLLTGQAAPVTAMVRHPGAVLAVPVDACASSSPRIPPSGT
jgi:hypothetical protein